MMSYLSVGERGAYSLAGPVAAPATIGAGLLMKGMRAGFAGLRKWSKKNRARVPPGEL
jgi:hypothetical protein